MTAHARLGASNAHRWMACPGSVRMSDPFPNTSSIYAQEGTAAHMLAQAWLTDGEAAAREIEAMLVTAGENTVVTVPVTPDMIEHVRLFVDAVTAAHAELGGQLLIEQRFNLSEYLDTPEPMFGTADAVVASTRALRVFDLKYGQGVVVEVKDNPQLIIYALGALFATGLHKRASRSDEVTVTIVQPRAPHPDGVIRSYTYTVADLMTFADTLLKRARATQAPDAPLVPGDHCKFCPAQAHCPAQRTMTQALAQVEFAAMPLATPISPESLSVEEAGDILTKAHVIEEWLNALRGRVQRELESGTEVPGWKLVDKRATRRWTSEQDYLAWAEGNGLDPFAPREPMSPAQMEKVVGKKNVPAELITSVSSGTTLVEESDPRPRAALAAQREFLALPSQSHTSQENS